MNAATRLSHAHRAACPVGTLRALATTTLTLLALRVVGDSMDRISPPDSIIFVNRADRRLVANGCSVIATPDGEATYKRYRPSPDRFEPVSVNPAHEPFFPDGMPKIVGRVRKSILDM
jgi:SOS-response transcriptional repressor LexA